MDASDSARRVRDALARAGYDEAHVLDLLGIPELPAFRHRPTLAGSLPRQGDDPLQILVRLFLLAETVALERARRALQPASVEDAVAAGLLAVEPPGARAAVEATPYEGLVVASDWPGGKGPDPLEVMGIAPSSRTLAQTMVRSRARRALDVGTGSGLLALLAAAHSDEVVATDVNPRALALARFNAEWNGVSGIAFREGDLFEPVRGEAFDLVVCNPPFVIAPAVEYVHTHSGRPTDALCREIVRAAPAHLSEGGLCQVLGNWAVIAGERWQDRLAGWLEGSGCDAWVLTSHEEDAAAYARGRVAEIGGDPDLTAARLAEWTGYYERERIEAVVFGILTMRRRGGSGHVFRCDRLADVVRAGTRAGGATAALRGFLEEAIREPRTGSRS